MTKIAYGNGVWSEYVYNASGQLTKLAHHDSSNNVLWSGEYEYGTAGEVTKVILDDDLTYPGDATIEYEYDDVYRLTREKCTPAGSSYRDAYEYKAWYDDVGNFRKSNNSGFRKYGGFGRRGHGLTRRKLGIVAPVSKEVIQWCGIRTANWRR